MPPPLSFQGDRILKERGKFEIPLSLSGVLWLLSFDTKRKQLAPAGAKSSLLPRSVKKRPRPRRRRHFLRPNFHFLPNFPVFIPGNRKNV